MGSVAGACPDRQQVMFYIIQCNFIHLKCILDQYLELNYSNCSSCFAFCICFWMTSSDDVLMRHLISHVHRSLAIMSAQYLSFSSVLAGETLMIPWSKLWLLLNASCMIILVFHLMLCNQIVNTLRTGDADLRF